MVHHKATNSPMKHPMRSLCLTYNWLNKIGLALARIVGLPQDVLEKATLVSKTLSERLEKQKRKSRAFHLSRRRNLVLKLKETLIQARDGSMEENSLLSWLAKVQDEFVNRMTKLSEDIAADESDVSEGEEVKEKKAQQGGGIEIAKTMVGGESDSDGGMNQDGDLDTSAGEGDGSWED